MTKIITRSGSGAAINETDNDTNLSSLSGKNQAITATSHTIDIDDQSETIEYLNAAAIAVTLPAISTVSGSSLDTDDFTVTLKNIGAGVVTITCGGSDTFDDGDTAKTLNQYNSITIQTDNGLTKWNVISVVEVGAIISDVNLITGIYTSASVSAGGSTRFTDAIDISALGSDDVDFGFSVVGSANTSLMGCDIEMQDPNNFIIHMGIDSTLFDFIGGTSTGKLSLIIDNTNVGAAQTYDVKWWARARL